MWIATTEQSKTLDQLAINEYGIASDELMERAGKAVFEWVQQLLLQKKSIGIFCGKGNNGGDGLVVARYAHIAGYKVQCFMSVEKESELSAGAQSQLKKAQKAGVKPVFYLQTIMAEDFTQCDLLIDALLGTGTYGFPKDSIADMIDAMNKSGVPILAIDVPSGICVDTGEAFSPSVCANYTLTLGLPKPFLFQGKGIELAGKWRVDDLGFPKELLNRSTGVFLQQAVDISQLMPKRSKTAHKGTNGHLLIVAGCDVMPGAAVLAVKGALRSGVGLCTLASTPEVCKIVAHHMPECLLFPLHEQNGFLNSESAHEILKKQSVFDAAVFGPGLGNCLEVRSFLETIWNQWKLPAVLDADALNAISQGIHPPKAPCVWTPHPGEIGRLLNMSTEQVQTDRFGAITQAIQQYKSIFVLKGAYSLIAAHDMPININPTGNPGMATGGMGDVLSGLIGGLLAQGVSDRSAAQLGVYIHGMAGDLCEQEIGPVGYTASDVALRIPKVLNKILKGAFKAPFKD